ncbi:MAG: phosphate ABC transporter permease subunit PstC [Anaerolineales bacterium]|nr:phosphate ABC transporter permease subunit PstC [Anaerolineales bacterium]
MTFVPRLFSRRTKDLVAGKLFILTTGLPFVVVIIIGGALLMRSRPILISKSIWDLIGGRIWQPLQGEFGFYPFIIGTIWVTVIAMLIAIPPCLLNALYLAEYARPVTRALLKPLLDLLAGIPSVVYGVWGMIVIVPWVQQASPSLSKLLRIKVSNPTGYSVLAGGIVLAVMVAPVIISVVYEVVESVPDGLRQASLAVGATHWQTIKYAVIPEAIPGIIAAVVLGFSRAFGETMAVLMVVGNVPQVPTSIFEPAYPLTALIANNYGEMMSIPLYDAALMGAALLLLVIMVIFNLISAMILNRIIRHKY